MNWSRTPGGRRKSRLHVEFSRIKQWISTGGRMIWIDRLGRLYYQHTASESVLPNTDEELFTIVIPQKMPGPFAETRHGEIVSYDEQLSFPAAGDEIVLRNYHQPTRRRTLSISILRYPERVRINTRTTAVYCEILKN